MGLGAQTSKPSPRGHARPHRYSRIEPPLGKGRKWKRTYTKTVHEYVQCEGVHPL